MIALTVVIHTAGIIGLIAYLKTHGARIVGHRNYIVMTRVLVVTARRHPDNQIRNGRCNPQRLFRN